VVFQQPLGPSKVKNSPSSMNKFTDLAAATSPKFLLMFLSFMFTNF